MRLIARIDIKNDHVIKGIHLEGLRKVGKPKELALKYTDPRADELLFMDAVASLYGRNNLFPIIREACEEIFIPVTVGGGIRTLEDIRQALNSGADKVAINTQAVRDPDFVRRSADRFGSQAIVGSIESKQGEVFINTGRERTGLNTEEWAAQLVELGAGEILITSIDREGTKKGFDIPLIEKINQLPVPVIACGGCGRPEHIKELPAGVSVAVASVLHYNLFGIEELRNVS